MMKRKEAGTSALAKVTAKRAPTKYEQEEISTAAGRLKDMPEVCALDVRANADGSDIIMDAVHSDLEGHTAWLSATLGTRSFHFVSEQLGYLEAGTRMRGKKRSAANGPTPLNSALAIVAAIRPENELEAALAVQMAMSHTLTTEMIARTRHTDDTDRLQVYGNLAVKMQRTFTAQIEALARLRGKGQQTVRVEHVTVEAGAQAIVGDVHHHPGGAGAPSFSEGQCHGKPAVAQIAPTDAPLTALPSQEQTRNRMPVSGDAEWPLPDARRNEPRRSKGEQ